MCVPARRPVRWARTTAESAPGTARARARTSALVTAATQATTARSVRCVLLLRAIGSDLLQLIVSPHLMLFRAPTDRCPVGKAWVAPARATDNAHYEVECSNKGVCNRETGVCQCMEGFTGTACQRRTWPCRRISSGQRADKLMIALSLSQSSAPTDAATPASACRSSRFRGCTQWRQRRSTNSPGTPI